MEIKDAIKFGKAWLIDKRIMPYDSTEREFVEMAIFALEKQVPKTPMEDAVSYNCPHCLHTVRNKTSKLKERFCNECGQAIEWDESR